MARPDKTQAVEEITTRFQESTAALLTEYRGLSVADIAELRGALREADADYKVLKNTLARIAAREVGMEDLVGMLEGPTAIAFCKGDAVAAAKALDEAARKFPVLVIKGGVLRGKTIDAAQTKALASLEPREIQLAKIAMMMNQPLQLTVNVFAAALRDLGSMLAQVLAKKESGELPSGDGSAAGAPLADAAATASDEAPTAEAPAEPAAEETADPAAEETADPAAEETAEPAAEETADPAAEETADPAPDETADPAPDETGDRGEAEVADAVAETESETSGDAAQAVEASSDTEQDSSTDEAAAGGDEKEE